MTATGGRQFYLEKRLGAGAFGEVFLAEQDSGAGFRRKVALKLLHPHVSGFKEAGRRFRDEARILGRLSHRHIVTVLDLVQFGNRWAVVMDYVAGTDLDRLMHALEELGEEFAVPAALECGAAIAYALDAAFHADDGKGGQLHVVHRDIKPSNVLVTPDGDVKVLDFGVARVDLDTREARTTRGLVGTERYMAPERLCGEGDLPGGDVYALLASVMELILLDPIGRTPVLDERHEVFLAAAIERVAPHLHGPADAREELLSLLRRGLAADPEARPSATEVGDALHGLARRLEGESLAAFARRVIPRVDDILGPIGEEVDGVLTVGSGDTGTLFTRPPTIAPPAMVVEPSIGSRSLAMIDVSGVSADRSGRGGHAGGGLVVIAALLGLLLVAGVAVAGVVTVVFGQGAPEVEPSGSISPVVSSVDVDPDRKPVAPEPEEEEPPVAVRRPVRRAAPREVQPAPEPEVDAPGTADPDAPRVTAALVLVEDASSVEVTCGDVTRDGTQSVRLKDFPAGACTVRAIHLGRELTGSVDIRRRREVRCLPQNGGLVCSW